MGRCRGLRLRGGAGLDRQDRLAGLESAPRRLHEGLRPPYAFDEQRDDAGVRIVDQEVQIVGEIEIGLVPGRDPVGETQAAVGAGSQPELQRSARLEHAGDRAGRDAAQFRVRIGEQPFPIAVRPHAFGAGQAQLGMPQKILEPGAALLGFRILAIADRARIDGGGFQSTGLRVGEHVGDTSGRNDHDGMIDRLRQRAQRRIAALPVNLALPRIDQEDPARIAELA